MGEIKKYVIEKKVKSNLNVNIQSICMIATLLCTIALLIMQMRGYNSEETINHQTIVKQSPRFEVEYLEVFINEPPKMFLPVLSTAQNNTNSPWHEFSQFPIMATSYNDIINSLPVCDFNKIYNGKLPIDDGIQPYYAKILVVKQIGDGQANQLSIRFYNEKYSDDMCETVNELYLSKNDKIKENYYISDPSIFETDDGIIVLLGFFVNENYEYLKAEQSSEIKYHFVSDAIIPLSMSYYDATNSKYVEEKIRDQSKFAKIINIATYGAG